ncbi:ribosome biogenesis GTPase YlqF [Salinibacillus xinjiangensis]|uniref:Ribosome biogenesis GTPase A n=1 Tax=Salinibacillus xinjiangensis TaxID=1229268 RepID=A0A6G1X3C2_9BACI|nr:ribosome biogenesis GTPase YlqF [Salinibacillus xinjiangensis]MRG85419.1 ribosome biogenesis GTPase YlqF [Salinibacillus xinjiangensis]
MTIQWFPGHMAKAKRQVEEKLKLVDFVIELVDARVPISSQNPMLQEVLGDKEKLILLMKKDLADPQMTKKWEEHFAAKGIPSLAVNAHEAKDIQQIVKVAKEIGEKKLERLTKKGVKPRPIRAMIVGIPNVGKSTVINRLVNKKIAKTGDRPGVTTAQQWIKVKKDFELLDTPGILWPKFEDEEVGYKLAAVGTIKDHILHLDDIAVFVLRFLKDHYPDRLVERYSIDLDVEDIVTWFDEIGKKRGCLASGGMIDYEKTSEVIIRDLRTSKLGTITFDFPDEG